MSWRSCIETLIGNIPFPTLVFDDSNKVILSNSIKSKACSWTMLTIMGQSLFDLFPSQNASLLHDVFLNTMESKKPCAQSMSLIHSKKPTTVRTEIFPIFDNDNLSWNLILVIKEQSSMELKSEMQEPITADVLESKKGKTRTEGEVKDAKAALRFLLREGAAELGELKREMYNKLANQILPFVESLKNTKLSAEQHSYAELLETNTRKLADPFGRTISDPMYKLSPTETKIAFLVREGKTNREIAKMLKVSKSTILTHRHHVRVKLGLKKQKQNLRSYLYSLGQQSSPFTKSSSPENEREMFSTSPDDK